MFRHHTDKPCPHMEGMLNRTADGTAGPLARWYALAHAARCTGCRDFLDALRGMLETMRNGRVGPNPEVEQRLAAIVRKSAP